MPEGESLAFWWHSAPEGAAAFCPGGSAHPGEQGCLGVPRGPWCGVARSSPTNQDELIFFFFKPSMAVWDWRVSIADDFSSVHLQTAAEVTMLGGSLALPTPFQGQVLLLSGCLGTRQVDGNSSFCSSPGTHSKDARNFGRWRSEEARVG